MTRNERGASRWRLAVTWCALFMGAGLAGRASDARSEVIWEGGDQSVLLAPQDTDAQPNGHPVSMAPQEIERMLEDLRFRHADEESTAPAAVFNKEQVAILGEALADGLARAKPSQDVTFSLIGAHRLSPGTFARRNRLTAGRAFFREGKLNVIFGEIQSPYRKKNIYGRIEQDFSPRQYGSRTAAREQESILVASAIAGLHEDAAVGTRGDWVVFHPGTSGEMRVESRSVAEAARRPSTPESPAETAGAGDADGERILASKPEQSAEAARSESIEQRLQTLKRLHEKELISEEAYRKRVEEILEEL